MKCIFGNHKRIIPTLLLLSGLNALAAPGEVWITPGTGTSITTPGTLASPFNASFETCLSYAEANYSPVTIHLLPGTYLTSGQSGFLLTANSRIIGAGENQSILMRDNTISDTALTYMLHSVSDNVEISDLTVDANAVGTYAPTLQRNGIFLEGSNCGVRRVHVLHTKGFLSSFREAFSILVGTAGVNTSYGNTIQDCHVDNVLGDYSNGIISNGECIIKNNHVVFSDTTSFGINCGSMNHTLIEGNYVFGGYQAFYSDTGDSIGGTVVNNHFENVGAGVFISTGYSCENMKLINNEIALNSSSPTFSGVLTVTPIHGVGIYIAAGTNANKVVDNILITGNSVRYETPPTGANQCFAYVLAGSTTQPIKNIYIRNNIFERNMVWAEFNGVVGDPIWFSDNFDLSGNTWDSKDISGTTDLPRQCRIGRIVPGTPTGTFAILHHPSGYKGKEIVIVNDSSFTVTASPFAGSTITGTTTIAAGGVGRFIADGNTKWFRQ